MRQVDHFIVGGAGGTAARKHQIWNPSTGEVQAEVALGDAALDVDPLGAVDDARHRVEREGPLALGDELRLFVPNQPVWPHLA